MIVTRIRPVRTGWDAGWGGLDRMRLDMQRWTEAMNRAFLGEPGIRMFPLVNVSHDDNNLYVRAELPGVKASNVELTVLGRNLTIKGRRELPEEDANVSYHRKEREGGSFSRSIELPSEVERDKIEARYEDGMLKVTLPRKEAAKPRQIPIEAS